MQLINMIMSLALLVLSLPMALGGIMVERDTDSFGDYSIAKPVFNGIIAGIPWTAQGDIGEVHAQFFAAHPEINEAEYYANRTKNETSERSIQERNKAALYCIPVPGQSWVKTSMYDVSTIIRDIDSVGGVIGIEARSCSRLGCINGATIWLCNDNNYWIQPSAIYIASYAQDIINHCTIYTGLLGDPAWTGGQEFDTDNYNVIVRYYEFC